jgi:putative membrane protein
MSDAQHDSPPDIPLPSMSLDRTMLANERTLLAYVRTSLAFLVSGVSAVHFLTSTAATVVGVALVVLGVTTMLAGVRSYWRVRGRARQAKRQLQDRAPAESTRAESR